MSLFGLKGFGTRNYYLSIIKHTIYRPKKWCIEVIPNSPRLYQIFFDDAIFPDNQENWSVYPPKTLKNSSDQLTTNFILPLASKVIGTINIWRIINSFETNFTKKQDFKATVYHGRCTQVVQKTPTSQPCATVK